MAARDPSIVSTSPRAHQPMAAPDGLSVDDSPYQHPMGAASVGTPHCRLTGARWSQVLPVLTSFGVISEPVMLCVCAGGARPADIVRAAQHEHVCLLPIDIVRGGRTHDLRRPEVQAELVRLCQSGVVSSAHFATDCSTFSPLNEDIGYRVPPDADGARAPPEFQRYVAQQNAMIVLCVTLATIIMDKGRPISWENPPRLDIEDTPWYWPEMSRRVSSLWHTSWLQTLMRSFSLHLVTASMCMFGSEYRKHFSLLLSHEFFPLAGMLEHMQCTGVGPHALHPPARGVDACGRFRAAQAGQYPWALCVLLVRMHAHAITRRGATGVVASLSAIARRTEPPASDPDRHAPDLETVARPSVVQRTDTMLVAPGAVCDSGSVTAALCALISDAAQNKAGFVSYRNLRAASEAELLATPLPSVVDMARRLAREASMQPPVPSDRIQWDGVSDWRRLVDGAPAGAISLAMLVGARLQDWRLYVAQQQTAFDCVRRGSKFRPPGDFVLLQSELPSWARLFVWVTEDESNCIPVVRSTRHTVFPGARQLDRATLRERASLLDWGNVDPDIVAQAGEGGCELRSETPLHTTASWHHAGVARHFDTADAIVRDELAEEWTRVCYTTLPFVPCVFSPRDVVLQERTRLVDGELDMYMKARVTHDLSSVPRCLGGRKRGVSINSGVPTAGKSLPGMPSVQSYARAQVVCDQAARSRVAHGGDTPDGAGVYGIDKEKAYCFLVVQQADHYAMCYLWPDVDGVVRPHVSTRVVFGGAPWPQRFERVALLDCAWIQRAHAIFDAQQPLPQAAVDWASRRERLQAAGRLPAGKEQLRPSGIEPFIDDQNGRALMDTVVVPAHLVDVPIGEAQTRAIGARPAHPSSRLAVHCKIAVVESTAAGWSIEASKTMCGDGMVVLGAQLDGRGGRVRCPAVKRAWMLHAVETLRSSLGATATVEVRLMERFVGRAGNLAQFFPELKLPLCVGYALSRVSWHAADGRRRRPLVSVKVRPRGRRMSQMLDLLDVVETVIGDAAGVAMAPRECFDSVDDPGVLVVVTDASRAHSDDGVGGFAFSSAMPGVCFIAGAAWPLQVKAALDRAALSRRERAASLSAAAPMLSMPTAEVFGAYALAAAVWAELGAGSFPAVVSVTDCGPAAKATSSSYSRSAQIRLLIERMRSLTPHWLGVHVPRAWNTDADRLSHPSQVAAVVSDAMSRDLRVIRVSPPDCVWAELEAAAQLPMATEDREWEC